MELKVRDKISDIAVKLIVLELGLPMTTWLVYNIILPQVCLVNFVCVIGLFQGS